MSTSEKAPGMNKFLYSTMHSYKHVSVIYLFVAVFIAYSPVTHPHSDNNNDNEHGAIYKLLSTKKMVIDDTETKITLEATVLFKPVTNINKIDHLQLRAAYHITILSVNILVHKGYSGIVNLNECPMMKKTGKELSETFYVSYLNGLFEYLQVPEDNENLSVNLKFLLSTIFQVDAKKLVEIRPRFHAESTRNIILGVCNSSYDVTREITRDALTYVIDASTDMNSCSRINQTGSLTLELDGICNGLKEKNLKYDTKDSITVAINSTFQTISVISMDENIIYNPWQGSPDNFRMTFRTTFAVESLTNRHSSEPENLKNGASEIVTDVKYMPLDKSLVDRYSSDPLIKTYSALACDPYNSNIYEKIYELAVKCSSTVK